MRLSPAPSAPARRPKVPPGVAGPGVLLLAALLLGSTACSRPEPALPAVVEPPLGSWRFVDLSGVVRMVSGGTPVLCREGRSERYPQRLYGESSPLSSLVLTERGGLRFAVALEGEAAPAGEAFEPRSIQLLSNHDRPPRSTGGLDVQTPDSVHAVGSWSWPERRVEGSVSSTMAPDETSEATLLFRFEGEFRSATELAGFWHYTEERLDPGGCWSRSAGRGEWRAIPADG